MNKKKLWQTTLGQLQLNLSRANFSTWFKQTQIVEIKKINPPLSPQGEAENKPRQLITIAVPNSYIKNTLENRYLGQIKEALDKLNQKENEVQIIIKKPEQKTQDTGPLFSIDFAKENKKAISRAIRASHLNPQFTFKNFAVSSSNEMAHAAAQAVAKNPGKTYHLLFLYGGVGVGKTHLSHAIGHEILENNPDAAVIYCTSEDFTNGIVEAIRNKTTHLFRQKYRSAKALVIDDIQFIGGKETVQEEFFHTFNAIHAEGGQIVLTSDCLSHEIKGLENRLRSRFEGGLTIDVQEPNLELRAAILLIKAKQKGQVLPMDAAQLIAEKITSTRRLEGFLTRLISQSQLKNQPITPDFCLDLMGEEPLNNNLTKRGIRPKEILNLVADFYNLKPTQLRGPKRAKPIVFPRQIAMYLIRKELETPYMEVGHLFGGRDHTTVMHAENKIDKMVLISEDLRLDLSSLKKKIYGYQ